MNNWTSGYVADIDYTYGYYSELNPLRIKLAFAIAGVVAPEIGNACELGFGQGLSTNIHAAASTVSWSGTDFNPSQAGFAQELARASGAKADLYDQSFAEYCSRTDLPDFDFIALHGIWSWISDENRQIIVDFIHRKLKVGGVLYISYNTLPGWSTFAPMRHLLTQHSDIMGADGQGIVSNIESSLNFSKKLLATNPLYLRANPTASNRLKLMEGQSKQYLAHEYFNKDWHPMYFTDMAKWLAPAKMSFACSASYLDYVDVINLTSEQQMMLKDISDVNFKQSVRDFMVNQQFRRDYWVKGARKLSPLSQLELLRKIPLVLITPKADIDMKVNGALGEATLSGDIYSPLLEALADHQIKTIGQLEKILQGQGMADILQSLMILAGIGHVQVAQPESKQTNSDALNNAIRNYARFSSDIIYLGSPSVGGGVAVGRFSQLFIQGLNEKRRTAQELAQYVWTILKSQGQLIQKEGKALQTEEENLAELTSQAASFLEKQLPILKALQVA